MTRVAIALGADCGVAEATTIAALVGGEVIFVEETDTITHDAWSSLPRFSARWPGKSRLQDIVVTGNRADDVRVWIDEMGTWDDMMSRLIEPSEPAVWKDVWFVPWKRHHLYRAGLGMRPNPRAGFGHLWRGVHLCGRDARRWKRRRFVQALRKEALR